MLKNIPHLKDITPDHIDALAKSVFKNRITLFFVQHVVSVLGLGTVGCVILSKRRFYSSDGTCKYVRVKDILNDSYDRRVPRIGEHRFKVVSIARIVYQQIATGLFIFFHSWFLRKWFKFLYVSEHKGYNELGRIIFNRVEKVKDLTWLTRKWYKSFSKIKSTVDRERELITLTNGMASYIKVNPFETKGVYRFFNQLIGKGYIDSNDCLSIFQDSYLASPILWKKSQKCFVYTFQLLSSTGKIELDEYIWKYLSGRFEFVIKGERKRINVKTCGGIFEKF